MSEKIIVKAPCVNYHGYALAEVTGVDHDTRGVMMFEVRALNGEPWFDNGFFGASPTSRAKFYPQALKRIRSKK